MRGGRRRKSSNGTATTRWATNASPRRFPLEGELVLRDGLKNMPGISMLHHALGLALVRLKRTDAALGELERATVLER